MHWSHKTEMREHNSEKMPRIFINENSLAFFLWFAGNTERFLIPVLRIRIRKDTK